MALSFRPPLFITFTGIDERTDIDRVIELSSHYPIEWGVLFLPTHQGMDPRYPSLEVIDRLRPVPVRKAAHLCGRHSRNVMNRKPAEIDLTGFDRIQVNHGRPDWPVIEEFAQAHGVGAIMQHRELTFPQTGSVAMLYDCSGGRGELPQAWPQHPGFMIGYAGGISPSNIEQVLTSIDTSGDYWLDMESGVRTDNWLDLDKCETVCRFAYGDQ